MENYSEIRKKKKKKKKKKKRERKREKERERENMADEIRGGIVSGGILMGEGVRIKEFMSRIREYGWRKRGERRKV